MRTRSKITTSTILVSFIWAGFGLRVFRLGAQSYWWDELSTVARTAVSFTDLFQNLFTVRNHMPLYFILMRGWATLGQEEFVMRLFSVFCGILMIPLIYQLGRLIAGEWVGITAAFLLLFSPFHIWYSQETRMYTLVGLATLLAHYFLFRTLNRPNRRDWVGYAVALTTAVYTHYLALFVLVAHYVFFSLHYSKIKRLFRQWIVYGGIVGVLFSIWGGFMMATGGFENAPIGWIPSAQWHEPLLTLLNFSAGPATSLLIGGWLLLLYLFAIGVVWWERGEALSVRLLLLWLFVPLLLQFVISLDLPIPNKRSIYVDRYLINSLPAFLILVAWGLQSLAKRGGPLVGESLLLLIVVLGTAVSLRPMIFDPQFAREDWRSAFDQLEAVKQDEETLFLNGSQTLPLDFYGDPNWELELLPFAFELEEKPTYFEAELPTQLAGEETIWVLTAVENINPHGFPQERNRALQSLESHDPFYAWFKSQYPIRTVIQTTGVQITRFDVSP